MYITHRLAPVIDEQEEMKGEGNKRRKYQVDIKSRICVTIFFLVGKGKKL